MTEQQTINQTLRDSNYPPVEEFTERHILDCVQGFADAILARSPARFRINNGQLSKIRNRKGHVALTARFMEKIQPDTA